MIDLWTTLDLPLAAALAEYPLALVLAVGIFYALAGTARPDAPRAAARNPSCPAARSGLSESGWMSPPSPSSPPPPSSPELHPP